MKSMKSIKSIKSIKSGKRDIKEDLIRIFTTLLHFHSTLGSRGNIATKFRVASYSKILSTLEKFEMPIYSSEDLKDIPNIGKSTLEKIDIIAKTGTHPLYEEILKNKEYQILLQFQEVRGIGPQKAYQIYKSGYRTIDQYRKDVLDGAIKTDTHLKASLFYMDDLKKKIPRDEITQFTHYLEDILQMKSFQMKSFEIKLINSGSYRMEKPFSGDIDLLCVVKDGRRSSESKRILKMIHSLCKHIYNESTKKINAIVENPLTKKIHQMDMLFVYEKEVPWMLLYFGSGAEFSKKIRAYAIQQGYKLNEKGLYYADTNRKVPFYPKNEREIFHFLKYPYVAPKNRV